MKCKRKDHEFDFIKESLAFQMTLLLKSSCILGENIYRNCLLQDLHLENMKSLS